MARYDHLPIYRSAMKLAVHLENTVRGFPRYVKYTLGSEMRHEAQRVVGLIIRPDYVLVWKRSVNNLRRRVEKFEREQVRVEMYDGFTSLYAINQAPEARQHLRGVVASYAGHFKWADTRRLRRSLMARYPWLNALYRLDNDAMPVLRKIKKNRR